MGAMAATGRGVGCCVTNSAEGKTTASGHVHAHCARCFVTLPLRALLALQAPERHARATCPCDAALSSRATRVLPGVKSKTAPTLATATPTAVPGKPRAREGPAQGRGVLALLWPLRT